MSEVAVKLQELITAMKDSEDYRRYSELEEKLKNSPALKKQIDEYRRRVYDMQRSDRDIYDETDYVIRDFRDLMKNPVATDYLDAERAVCAMIQRAVDAINAEVAVELPQG